MENIVSALIYILLFLSPALSYYLTKKQERKDKGRAKLPPGSMGWPYTGETLQLYSQDPNIFLAQKQKRYGDIFKINILGCPCIMMASPESSRFVLVTHAHLFKPTYPKSKEMMIGPWALFFHEGKYHNHLRKLVPSSLSPEALRKLVPDIEAIAISCMEAWTSGLVINTFREMKKFVTCLFSSQMAILWILLLARLSFEVGILAIFGHLETKYKNALRENYNIVERGYNSFPTNLPGTPYHKARVARKRLNQIIREIISERKEKKLLDKDLLGHLLNFEDDGGQTLTEDQIADNIIGALFAAQDTTASVLTWILKYLHDDQKLLEAVKIEQTAIYKSNNRGKQPLTWAQTRNMPLTLNVILESLRMASIISFTFREAVSDVEYDGFLIRKGWKVMPLFRNIHHSPEYFMDPKSFDPSRFEVAPKPNTFMPFGSGSHACPGNELAKLEMLITFHHLVTKYRWEVVGSKDGIPYSPFPVPLDGLPAKFYENPTSQ